MYNFCVNNCLSIIYMIKKHLTLIQPYAVDHLARESMKSAANCVN